MLNRLTNTDKKVVGLRQTLKAIDLEQVEEVYLARDCDSHIFHQVERKAHARGIPVRVIPNMKGLGKACGIEVSAAVAALIK
ncbi:MAG: ribosomal L7Ae/L30e/S12e/Gadd45 family protein [Halanaerobium sp.]|nr:ribosomal L7Ae/L30e/S12e/Gadd45 family protein [Halanaerobium sp.]